MDRIAGYLKELQDAGVPVLFRPYHEMNGNWFWWGGRPGPDGSAALYRQIYDRYVHVHHLNNLVWVWNVNSPSGNTGSVADYFPGSAYADVLTMDIYGPFSQEFYDQMVALADPLHKPIALAEVGAMPSYCDTTPGLTCYTTDQLKAGIQSILVQGAAGAQGGAIGFCVTSIVPHDIPDAGTVGGVEDAGTFPDAPIITIDRDGGTPISPFAFGNNYYDSIDWSHDGTNALMGTEVPVQAMKLNVIVANSNNTDSDQPELFDDTQIDAYVKSCRAVGAEPIMEVPVTETTWTLAQPRPRAQRTWLRTSM